MRITIIILGVIGLLFLGFNWDTLSPDAEAVPREGSVLHSKEKVNQSKDKNEVPSCPTCKEEDEIVVVTDVSSQKNLYNSRNYNY